MRNTMVKFVNEGKLTWTATFIKFSITKDADASKDIQTVKLKDVKDSQGNIIAHTLTMRKNEAFKKAEKFLTYGDSICFTGEVKHRYTKNGGNYYIEGADYVIKFDPGLIDANNIKVSVHNLRIEKYTIKNIAFILNTYTDKVYRIIREDEELRKELSLEQQAIIISIQYWVDKGESPRVIIGKLKISMSSYYTYRPYLKKETKKAA